MTADWELPGGLDAAAVARQLVADDLAERGIDGPAADDVVLIASELAANAVRHGEPPALLRLDHLDGRVRILVANHGNAPDPRVLTANPDDEHGRGLSMVESLADEVGWERVGDRLEVWAIVRVSR